MKTLIAVPAMEQIHTWTAQCLANLRHVGECKTSFIVRMQVDAARNTLAKQALEEGCERILWIDSDMTFEPDLMERLGADIDAGWDVVSGLYFKRKFPAEPVIYRGIEVGGKDGATRADTYWDYPQDSVFEIAGCGFGGVLMRTDVLLDLEEPPFQPFLHLSEDLSFCVRMLEHKRKIACDSRVKLGHMGTIVFSEKLYKHPQGG